MLSDETRAALANVRKLAEGKPWYRPPPPKRPALAVVRTEPPKPKQEPTPTPATVRPLLVCEVRTEPGNGWFTCIASRDLVTGELLTLEAVAERNRRRWPGSETRLKEVNR